MKKGFKFNLALFLFSGIFWACSKYTYTAPLYPTPPAGYYDEVSLGTIYNGNLIVAGNFLSLFGSSNNIAQWNGSSWQSLGYGVGGTYAGGWVSALNVYNSNLIVAGYFDSAGGQRVNSIAQWNGSSWLALGSGITSSNNTNVIINALTVYNGSLIVGGQFSNAGGFPSANLSEWSGSSWLTTLGGVYTKHSNYYTNNYASLSALVVYNGNLIIGGYFDKEQPKLGIL